MELIKRSLVKTSVSLLAILILMYGFAVKVYADLYISVVAVNATDFEKQKDISLPLPKELTVDDILDTSGLELAYDVDQAAYYVHGKVKLAPKESKSFKVRIKDVWKIDEQELKDIRQQVDRSLERIKNTEYYEVGLLKKDILLKRLDYIIEQQAKFADDVNKRIDQFRIYSNELKEIRSNALSVKYWRTKPPVATDNNVINFVFEVENNSEDKNVKTGEQRHYLPPEVKPEHLVNSEGFDLGYDAVKGQSFITKDEELRPKEKKKYTVGVVDIWSIPQQEIDQVKDRTREVFKLLEKTEYKDSATFLVASIKDKIEKIELSQSVEKEINEHISAFRTNARYFDSAKQDLQSMQDLLDAVREKLERSILKNALQKIKSLKSVADISKAIFGEKWNTSVAWKIIISVLSLVAIITIWNFVVWVGRSKDVRKDQMTNVGEKKPEDKA